MARTGQKAWGLTKYIVSSETKEGREEERKRCENPSYIQASATGLTKTPALLPEASTQLRHQYRNNSEQAKQWAQITLTVCRVGSSRSSRALSVKGM